MSKYADLFERIMEDNDAAAIMETLEWLDEHPDQVPGPTLTESESKHLFDTARQGLRYWPNALDRAGITIIPDPKPTNAELLAELIREVGYDIRHNGRLSGSNALALDLDSRGVKAPGGDDD